jgi:HD-GYP domain-containing protein (c-di-GMP phosphodiesterase class II)
VAALVREAARQVKLDAATARTLGRAALVHDVGRVSVTAAVWDKPGPLNDDEWERVRAHTYVGERILSRSRALAPVAEIATLAHERLDGAGYHRRLRGDACTAPARLLAAADVFHAMTEARPHRGALSADEAASTLSRMAKDGSLCPDAVAAVLAAVGRARPPHRERPAGLTDREVDVLRLVARGLTNKEVASSLDISVKTAGNHLQNVFQKIGVTTRAGAAMYAMQRGIVAD